MKKIIRLTEHDLRKIVRRVLVEDKEKRWERKTKRIVKKIMRKRPKKRPNYVEGDLIDFLQTKFDPNPNNQSKCVNQLLAKLRDTKPKEVKVLLDDGVNIIDYINSYLYMCNQPSQYLDTMKDTINDKIKNYLTNLEIKNTDDFDDDWQKNPIFDVEEVEVN